MASWHEPLAVGVALEAVAAIAAIDGLGAPALVAHVAACGAIAVAVTRRLPPPAGASSLGSPARLVFTTALLLPVLGALGWIAVALVSPRHAEPRGHALACTPVPDPEAARIRAEQPARRPGSASARVVAARGRQDAGAIALLRRALANPDEDVRLVAHAVLESRHRAADHRLHDLDGALEAAPAEQRAPLHRRLAAEHWELARLGLVEGECLAHALDRAHQHAHATPDSAARALLLGRIELRRGNAGAAEAALAHALALGLPPEVAAPYLAEAAFLERRYDRVRQRLAETGTAAPGRLRRFWS
jgi:polysaccharide biosynthesis protein PelE